MPVDKQSDQAKSRLLCAAAVLNGGWQPYEEVVKIATRLGVDWRNQDNLAIEAAAQLEKVFTSLDSIDFSHKLTATRQLERNKKIVQNVARSLLKKQT